MHVLAAALTSARLLLVSDYCSSYIANSSAVTNYTVLGGGNYSTCRAFVETTVYNSTLAVLGANQPDPVGAFMGFSSYYYTASFLFPDMAPLSPTIDQLDARLAVFCSYSYAELTALYPNISAPYLVRYCTNGIYIRHLLAAGYRFPTNDSNTEYVANVRAVRMRCRCHDVRRLTTPTLGGRWGSRSMRRRCWRRQVRTPLAWSSSCPCWPALAAASSSSASPPSSCARRTTSASTTRRS